MKKKKKLLSLILAMSIIVGQVMPAYAVEPDVFYVDEDSVVQGGYESDSVQTDDESTQDEASATGAGALDVLEDTEDIDGSASFEEVNDSEYVDVDSAEEPETEVYVTEEQAEEQAEEALGAENTKKDSSSSSSAASGTDSAKTTVSPNVTNLEKQYVNVKKKVKIKIPGVTGKDKKRIVWSSTKPAVAQVKKGKVVGVARGMAEIHAVLDGMDYVTVVFVNEPKVRPGKKIKMEIGETCYGTITGILDQPIRWENSKPEVAQVTASGNGFVAVGKAKGSTKVVCKIGKKKYKITLKVGKTTYDGKEKIEWEEEDLWPVEGKGKDRVPGERLFKCSNGTCYSRYFYNYGKYPYDPDYDPDADDGKDDDKDDGKEPKAPEREDEEKDPGTPGGGEDSVSSNNGVTISMNYVEPGTWVEYRNIYVTIDPKIIKPYGKRAYVWVVKGVDPYSVKDELWQATPNFTMTANGTYELYIKTLDETGKIVRIIKGGEVTIGNIDDESPDITEEPITVEGVPTFKAHVKDLRSGLKSIVVIDPKGKKSEVPVKDTPKYTIFSMYDYLTVPGMYTIIATDNCHNETKVVDKIYSVPGENVDDIDPTVPSYNPYTITYNANYPDGKNETEVQKGDGTVARYAKLIDAGFSTPDGYSFDGWAEDPKATKAEYIAGKAYDIKGDKVVYAVWTLDKYDITYILDGGQNNPENPKSFTVKDADIVLKDAQREHYNFTGWYTDKYCQNKIEKITPKDTGFITIYAGWDLPKYNITYHLDGGNNSDKNPSTYTVLDKDITLADASKKHYSFDGWYEDEEYKVRVYTIDTAAEAAVDVYAKFTPVVYTVTYELDGGVNDDDNIEQFTVEDADFELKDASKQYYEFGGWFARFDLSDASKVTKIDCSNGEDRTLYAKFIKNVFTITKEEGYTGEYDGSAHSIQVETSTDGATIEYSSDGGTNYSALNPSYSDIGEYTIYYRITKDNYEPYENSLQIVINPIDISHRATVTFTDPVPVDYDGYEHTPAFKVELEDGSELMPGINYTYEYKDNINAGTASLVVTGQGFYGKSITATFTINKVAPDYSDPSGRSLVYSEVDQELVTGGMTSDGVIMYSLNGGDYSANAPKAKKVGTYTIKYYVKGDRNHTDSEVKTITTTIAKAPGQLTVGKSGFVYGQAQSDLNLYSDTHSLMTVSINYTGNAYSVSDSGTGEATGTPYNSRIAPVNAGSYTVTVSLPETENYEAVQKSVSYKILKAEGDITAPEAVEGLVYDGTEHNLITPGSSTTGTVWYKVGDGEYDTVIPKATDAGNYTVYYKVDGTENYKAVAATSFVVNVAKAAGRLTLTSTSGTLTYPASVKVTVSENLSGGVLSAESGDEDKAIASVEDGVVTIVSNTTPGVVTIVVTAAATKNYNAASAIYEATIKKGTLGEIHANNKTAVYSGNAQYLTAPLSETPGVTFTYGLSAGEYDYTTIMDPALGVTDVGSKTVYWRASLAGYNDKTGSYTLTVTKADATMTKPTAKTLTYNDTSQTLINPGSATGGTIYYGVALTSGTVPSTWSADLPSEQYVGTYYVWSKVLGDTNHNDVAAEFACSVSIANGTLGDVTAQNLEKTYNGSMQYLNAVTCATSGVTITYGTTSGTYGYSSITNSNLGLSDVGTKTVYYKVSKSGYNDKTGSYVLTIKKAASSMTKPTAKSLTYTGSAQTLVNAGSASGGVINYGLGSSTTAPTSWSASLPTATDVGTYYVWSKVLGDSNHSDTAAAYACAVTISKATLGAVTATPLTKIYNGSNQYLGAVTCATAGTTITYGTSSGTYSYSSITNTVLGMTNVGTKTVYYKVSKTGYEDKTGSYTLTINKATPTLTKPTTKGTLTYTGSAQTLANAGSTTGGTLQYGLGSSSTSGPSSWSTSIPTATASGTYYVWVKVDGNSNYNSVAATYACSTTIQVNKTGTVDYMTCLYADGDVYKTSYQSAQAAITHSADSGNTVASGIASGSYSYNFKAVGSNKDSAGFLFHATNMKNRTITVKMIWTNNEGGPIVPKTYSGTTAPTLSSSYSNGDSVASGASGTTTLTITSDGYYGFGFDTGGSSKTFPVSITITNS